MVRKTVNLLYLGLMLMPRAPRVLEYNCRFGDPETHAGRVDAARVGPLFSLLESGLFFPGDARWARSRRTARSRFPVKAAATVVLAAGGYPGTYANGGLQHDRHDARRHVLLRPRGARRGRRTHYRGRPARARRLGRRRQPARRARRRLPGRHGDRVRRLAVRSARTSATRGCRATRSPSGGVPDDDARRRAPPPSWRSPRG